MDFKKTAQDLLKLADKLEKEASDNSYFICAQCNHTATLTQINDRRAKLASQDPSVVLKNKVTVNDVIACGVPGCEGTMAYVASDESEKYYTDEKTAEEGIEEPGILDIDETLSDPDEKKEEKPKAKKEVPDGADQVGDKGDAPIIQAPAQEPPANPIDNPPPKDDSADNTLPAPETPAPETTEQDQAPVENEMGDKEPQTEETKNTEPDQDELDVDSLFEDVDTQNQNQKAEKKDTVQQMEQARLENKAKKDLAEMQAEKKDQEESEGDTFPSDAKDPMNAPSEKTEPDPAALKDQPEDEFEEEGEEVEKPKKTPKTKEEEILEKKSVPKFKSKEASDRFVKALDRYSK